MHNQRIFVYVVCGSEKHINTLHLSLRHLKPLTQNDIIVVTDRTRNQLAINHDQILDVRTPEHFDNHQASIYLKTSLHRYVDLQHEYCYLDSDVIAGRLGVDTIFEHQYGPITFARNLTTLEGNVSRFSPWAVNCSCTGMGDSHSCTHLLEAIEAQFGIRVAGDWVDWNGGVFLFGKESVGFMQMWHEFTMQIFQNSYWKTRDQGTLVATAWKLGLQDQRCLPLSYNFIIDLYNNELCFSKKEGYCLHHSKPKIHPYFLHLFSSDLSREGWNIAIDVEEIIYDQMRRRGIVMKNPLDLSQQPKSGRGSTSSAGLRAKIRSTFWQIPPLRRDSIVTPSVRNRTSHQEFKVIVAAPYWAMNGVNIFSANLVRGLQTCGISAQILLTEQNSTLVTINEPLMTLPEDIPVVELPVSRDASWGAHWGTLIRYLEEHAPCIYIPNSDWRHSIISPKLSNRVAIVGVVHSDDPLHYDHVTRMGRYWNAIVTTSQAIAEDVAAQHPALSERLLTIPIGVPVPDHLPIRTGDKNSPLRIIYHGGLTQHQKRILDWPPIVEALLERQVPVELTIVGDGADRERLLAASQHLVECGAMRFLGVLPHAQILQILEQQDVYILTSEFEGMPNALNEAMGRGCVPVVTDIRSGIPELVRDGVNGYRVPVGDIQAFAERLALLQRHPERRRAMALQAHRTVIEGGYRTEDMVQRYIELFQHIWRDAESAVYRRPHGLLRKPPYEIAGSKIFPIPYACGIAKVGIFPSYREDYEDYKRELDGLRGHQLPAWNHKLVQFYPVIVSATSGRISGVDVFSVNLVRGLHKLKMKGHVLMTCHDESPPDPMPLPRDIPVQNLPVGKRMWPKGMISWRTRWQRLINYLERQAPCIYIPNYDWRHSCVSPQLSQKVGIVGIVHSDDPQHYEHVSRLGRYWNAIVAVSPAIAARVAALDPTLVPRLVTIPYGVEVPPCLPERDLEANAPLKVVYAGRVVQQQKRVGDLPKIISALHRRGIPVELTIIGAGSEDAQLRDACQPLIAEGLVYFLGTLPNAQVLKIFEQSDVFILTSDYEGLPLSLLEAMARGCVPVVTDLRSGIPELVRDGVNGYRVPVGDIQAFAERLSTLQRLPTWRRELASQAYHTIRTQGYDVERMVERYLMLFERVLREAETGIYRRPRGKVLPLPSMKPFMNPSWRRMLPDSLRKRGEHAIRQLFRAYRS